MKENNQDGSRMEEVSWDIKLKAICKQEKKNEHLTSGKIRISGKTQFMKSYANVYKYIKWTKDNKK